jgi:hypothetical protein
MGSSELISPGGPDADTERIGNQQFTQGVNPGKGWTPGNRFQKVAPQQPVQNQMQAIPQPQMGGQGGGQDFPDNDGSMGWADTSKKTYQNVGQSDLVSPSGNAGAAFSQNAAPQQQEWALPSAQSGAAWQAGIENAMQQAAPGQMQPMQQQRQAVPQQRAAQPNLSGRVSQSAIPSHLQTHPQGNMDMSRPLPGMGATASGGGVNMAQPMPGMGGMGGGMAGGMNMAQPMPGMGGMGGGMAGGMNMAQPMPGVGGMGGMGGMQGSMPMAGGMGTMQGMTGGMGAGMQQNMGAMGGGGMGGMGGGMGALGALMGGGMGGGMGGAPASPFDMLGKAIAGAAQMGLIPGTQKQGMPSRPTGYGQPAGGSMQGGTMQGGSMQGGGNYYSSGASQGVISQQRSKPIGQTLSRMPGAKTAKQMGRTVNRGIQRNLNYAINSAAQRGITRALWGY